jgi:hypothetical protein
VYAQISRVDQSKRRLPTGGGGGYIGDRTVVREGLRAQENECIVEVVMPK